MLKWPRVTAKKNNVICKMIDHPQWPYLKPHKQFMWP